MAKGELLAAYEKALKDFEIVQKELETLDERAYAFLKTLRRPPPVFWHIISGVLLIMGYSKTEWNDCKKFLISPNSRKRLLDFNIEKDVDPKNLKALEKFKKEHKASFTHERAERVSQIALLLLKWLDSLLEP
eukprot:UN06026